MNPKQKQYLLQHYKTKSVKELAAELKIDREVLRRELKTLLSSQPQKPELPEPPSDLRFFTALQIAATVLASALLAAFLFYKCQSDPNIPFLAQKGKAEWILLDDFRILEWVDADRPSKAHIFEKNFKGTALASKIILHARAFKNLSLDINGARLPEENFQVENWKNEIRVDITAYLKPEENKLLATVANKVGPPALWLWIEGLGEKVSTDASWRVGDGSEIMAPATIADELLLAPSDSMFSSRLYPTGPSAKGKLEYLALFFVISGGIFLAGHFGVWGISMKRLPLIALVLITAVWTGMFFSKWQKVPMSTGYDVKAHLSYVEYLIKHGGLPKPTGAQTLQEGAFYHPPLYYLLCQIWLKGVGGIVGERIQFEYLKWIPFMLGLGNLWLAWLAARKIFREDPVKITLMLLFAALIPMNIFFSVYITNETLQGFLASWAVYLAFGMLTETKTSWRSLAMLGLVAGLAFLTKVTAVVLVPVAGLFVGAKLLFVEKKSLPGTALSLGLFGAVFLSVISWFFFWNYSYSGTILPGFQLANQLMWQSPGFHTWKYFSSFGLALKHPYYASMISFWDGIYSTFWGDGYAASRPVMGDWNYQYMTISYLLGLPATLMIAGGLIASVKQFFTHKSLSTRLLHGFGASMIGMALFFVFHVSLTCPYWTLPKAFYGLFALLPIAFAGAFCLGELDHWLVRRGMLPLRVLIYGWLGTLLIVVYLSYWAPFALPATG